jgi:hypothetical protein
VPSLHDYALYDKVIRKFAGNFVMASYDKLIILVSIVVYFEYITK